MKKRKNLVLEIEKFVNSATKLYNETQNVDKSEYKSLLSKCAMLIEEDFVNAEKWYGFQKFMSQPDRKMKRELIEKSFNETNLESGPFLGLIDDLLAIVGWIK